MKYRFTPTNLCSILVAVTTVFTPSIPHERSCASSISQNRVQLILSINIPIHQVYPKFPH